MVLQHVRQRPARRVVEARRPGHGTFCTLLLLRDRHDVALLVHAVEALRLDFDRDAVAELVDALGPAADGDTAAQRHATVVARRPGHREACPVLLSSGDGASMQVPALDDLRVELDPPTAAALVRALQELTLVAEAKD